MVCPSSLVRHWLNELKRCISNSTYILGISIEDMKSISESSLKSLGGEALLILSYGSLRKHVEVLRKVEFEVFILDEAHCIKNSSTALAQAMFSMRSKRRLALSGTPVQNEVEDMWSIMNFLLPNYLGE